MKTIKYILLSAVLIGFTACNDDEYDYGNIPPPPPPPAPKNENDLNIEGKIVSINNDVISYVEVVDAFDKKHTLIVSTQFEGAQLLIKSNFLC